MKKLIVGLALILSFSVVGCGEESSKKDDNKGEEVANTEKTNEGVGDTLSLENTTKQELKNIKDKVTFRQELIGLTHFDKDGNRVPNPEYVSNKMANMCTITNNSDKVISKVKINHLYYNQNDNGEVTTIRETVTVEHDVKIQPNETIKIKSITRNLTEIEGYDCVLEGVYE